MSHRLSRASLCALFSLVCLAVAAPASAATAGDVDPTYGSGGRAFWSYELLDGTSYAGGPFGWARFRADGAHDTGPYVISGAGTDSVAGGIVDDGTFVMIAGTTTPSGSAYTQFVLGRYQESGAQINIKYADFGADAEAHAVAQTYPGTVVAGSSGHQLAMARFRSDTGELDTGFDFDGTALFDINFSGTATTRITPNAVYAMPDDSVFVTGKVARDDGLIETFVAHIDKDGTPVAGFGTNGFKVLHIGEAESAGVGIATAAGGRLIVGVSFRYNASSALGAINLSSTDGSQDTSYGSGGVAAAPIIFGNATARAATADSAGRALVAGEVIGAHRWAVARFTATGMPDSSFGANGVATFDMGESGEAFPRGIGVQAGDRPVVIGDAVHEGVRQFAVARLLASGEQPAQQPPGSQSSPSGSPSTDQGQTSTTTTVQPALPATMRVDNVDFTVVADTARRVKMPRLVGHYLGSASDVLNSSVPFVDIDWDYSADVCGNGISDGTVRKQSIAPDTLLTVTAQSPAKVRLSVCLNDRKYEQTCSAAKLNGVLKGVRDHMDLVQRFFDEVSRCKLDYDVKLVKKADDPALGKVTNAPAKAKRKPIQAAIECPSDPAVQHLRTTWDEGAFRPNTYGFHAGDSQDGWTLPAGVQSFFRVTISDLAKRFVRATVYIDTDGVGAVPIPAYQTDQNGQKIYPIFPAHPGKIRACVVYETSDGNDLFQTTTIDVVAKPKVGEVWPTASGREIKMTKDGPVAVASSAAATAHSASILDDIANAFKALFGYTSKTVAKSTGTPQAKAQAARKNGYAVGQMSNGGTLGRQPGMATVATGPVVTLTNGKLGVATGRVIVGARNGTLVGVGDGLLVPKADQAIGSKGNVVPPGGGNIVPPKGSQLISDNGLGLISDNGLGLIGQATGNLLGANGTTLIGAAASNLIGQATGNLIGQASGNLIGAATSNVIPPGGLN